MAVNKNPTPVTAAVREVFYNFRRSLMVAVYVTNFSYHKSPVCSNLYRASQNPEISIKFWDFGGSVHGR